VSQKQTDVNAKQDISSILNEESWMVGWRVDFIYVLSVTQTSPSTGILETNRRKSDAQYFSVGSEKSSTMRSDKAGLDLSSAAKPALD
jgi:hypothetical protein